LQIVFSMTHLHAFTVHQIAFISVAMDHASQYTWLSLVVSVGERGISVPDPNVTVQLQKYRRSSKIDCVHCTELAYFLHF
jgi:hypothetical protein